MLDRAARQSLLPRVELGPDVSGASYCWRDGHVNPLQLLQALHSAIARLGGRVLAGHPVQRIERSGQGFQVASAKAVFGADRVVIAAGVASGALAAQDRKSTRLNSSH